MPLVLGGILICGCIFVFVARSIRDGVQRGEGFIPIIGALSKPHHTVAVQTHLVRVAFVQRTPTRNLFRKLPSSEVVGLILFLQEVVL